ncbi:Prefoldin beta-like protein [Entophlyctis helioformis]|nr:Prefoldin beta-like protein [Entophlyctis helioformis]
MTSLKLPTDETDAEVTWEDQRNINQFSKLNIRLENYEEAYKTKKSEKEYLDDLTNELELADEDEPVKYRIGDAYVSLSLATAQVHIERAQSQLDKELGALSEKIDDIRTDMAKLKALLYGKFGKSINLEKD